MLGTPPKDLPNNERKLILPRIEHNSNKGRFSMFRTIALLATLTAAFGASATCPDLAGSYSCGTAMMPGIFSLSFTQKQDEQNRTVYTTDIFGQTYSFISDGTERDISLANNPPLPVAGPSYRATCDQQGFWQVDASLTAVLLDVRLPIQAQVRLTRSSPVRNLVGSIDMNIKGTVGAHEVLKVILDVDLQEDIQASPINCHALN